MHKLGMGGEVPISQDQPGLICFVDFDSWPGFIPRGVQSQSNVQTDCKYVWV